MKKAFHDLDFFQTANLPGRFGIPLISTAVAKNGTDNFKTIQQPITLSMVYLLLKLVNSLVLLIDCPFVVK